MTVDLCVITYNSRHDIERLITALTSEPNDGQWRLYIADNGSTDGTQEYLRTVGIAEIIKYNTNIGYGAACNELASYGDSEFIALCNADIWLQTSDVTAMMKSFEETGADILGPKQRDQKGLIRHGGIFGTNTAPKFRGWAEYDPTDTKYRDRVDAVTVSGSAYFIRRSVWNKLTNDKEYRKIVPDAVGAFFPTFFYYEETGCSYFARHRGYKLMYDGTVSIGHDWHSSHPKNDYLDKTIVHESRAIFRDICDRLGILHD